MKTETAEEAIKRGVKVKKIPSKKIAPIKGVRDAEVTDQQIVDKEIT